MCVHSPGHVTPSRVHLHILKPVSFSLASLPCVCVRAWMCVCVQICIHISPSAEIMWSEQEVSELPGSNARLNHSVICVLHRESCGKVNVITNHHLCMQRLSGDRFVYRPCVFV
jgi:hypothetical protein